MKIFDMDVYNYPVPFCLVRNFLKPELESTMRKQLEDLKKHLKPADKTGAAMNQNTMLAKKKGLFLHECDYLRSNKFFDTIMDIVKTPEFIDSAARKNWFFEYLRGDSKHGTLVSLYEEGDEYKHHKDSAYMSIIYYFFDGEFEGGDFFLKNVKVPIEHNSLIIFPSCTQHAVSPLKGPGKRWSITNFFTLASQFHQIPDNIQTFKNFTTPDEWKEIKQGIQTGMWIMKGASNPSNTIEGNFWFMDLNHVEFFTKHLFERIPNGPWKLERVYANGQSFGQNGAFHQDSTDSRAWTFLLYMNEIETLAINSWGGQTEFETTQGRIVQIPEPNLGILFPSNIHHRGLGPSRYVNDLRVTVAWKLMKQ